VACCLVNEIEAGVLLRPIFPVRVKPAVRACLPTPHHPTISLVACW